MRLFILCLLKVFVIFSVQCQDSFTGWPVGTKWVYSYAPASAFIAPLEVEIVDTLHWQDLLLYELNYGLEKKGPFFFYYENNKVYSYDTVHQYAGLLYDFSNDTSYITSYRPICSIDFDYDNQVFEWYNIEIDSTEIIELSDGTERKIQYASSYTVDGNNQEIFRYPILEGVGMLRGALAQAHDWELGMDVCSPIDGFVFELRCFESGEESYSFVDYPCDSSWFVSSIEEENTLHLRAYPNPSSEGITIEPWDSRYDYRLYTIQGLLVEDIRIENGQLSLPYKGVFYLSLTYRDSSQIMKLIRY